MNVENLEMRLGSINQRLTSLFTFLRDVGFTFQYPNEAFPGPDADLGHTLHTIEEVAGPIPVALKRFYRMIGSINFNGSHPDWTGCDLPDSLIVFPIGLALVELEDFRVDPASYKAAYGSFRIPVAPDALHKEGISGGMWYGVPVPCVDLDPPLLEEPHETTFLNYLEVALDWGGFPGLEFANPNHTWPLGLLQQYARA